MAKGLDTAENTATQDAISCLKSDGFTFVLRYYANAGNLKVLTYDEAQALSADGFRIGVAFETNPTYRDYFTTPQGTADARTAVEYAYGTIGQPYNSAIYFAVDFAATAAEAAEVVTSYFKAINAEIVNLANQGYPEYAVGVYGDGAVCSELLSAGLAFFTWLAGATHWPGYDTFTAWNLKQGSSSASLCHISYDPDESSGAFGGFNLAEPA